MADNQQTQAIDPRERYHDEEESLRTAFEGLQAGLWTAMPVSVISYNAELQTVSAQINVQAQQRDQFGNFSLVTIKPLLDCPVMFPTGGGFTLTFPIAAGDEGLVIFASRCIDNWWQNGKVQPPYELHMHDLSDGFYLPGCRSNPRALGGVSGNTAQFRSDDGNTYVEIAAGGVVNIKAPGGLNINTTTLTLTGNLAVSGEITDENGNHSLSTHVHSGVQPGSGDSGPPVG